MPSDPVLLKATDEPVRHGGPGSAWRRKVPAANPEEGGKPSEFRVRRLTAAEAGGDEVLERVAAAHERASAVGSAAVLLPTEFGIEDPPAGEPGTGRRFFASSPWPAARSLGELLATVDVVPDPLTEAIAKGACDALAAVHECGFRVVGLTPDSLLMRDDGTVVLADVGFAPAMAPAWPAEGPAPPTLLCAAPEVVAHVVAGGAGPAPDARADLYALGAILFRCMTGRWHRPDDARAIRASAAEMLAPAPAEERSGASQFLSEVVRALVEVDPADRFESASALAVVLVERRRGEWWRRLSERQSADQPPAVAQPEPEGPEVPEAPAPPAADWYTARRARIGRLGEHAAPCVGRDRELEVLLNATAALREGRGGVVLVEGEGGVGKSRLLDAFLERVSAMPEDGRPIVLCGEHRRLGIGRPFGALTEALTRWISGERVVAAADVAPLLGEMAALAPVFAAFLSGETPPAAADRELTAPRISTAFVRCLHSLGGVASVVVVVENLQWTDSEGLELFARVAAATDDLPLLLVGTHRPASASSPLASLLGRLRKAEGVAAFALQRLSPPEVATLVGSLVTPPAAAQVLSGRLHTAVGGSPLLVLETVRALEDEGHLVRLPASGRPADSRLSGRLDGRLEARPSLLHAEIPSDEHEVLHRRLARLSADERNYLEAAAVQGVMFDAEVARLSVGFGPAVGTGVLESLARRGLVEGEGVARRFASHALFDHVHEAIDDDDLRLRHEAVGTAFLASRNPDGSPPAKIHGILAYRVAWHHLSSGNSARGLLYMPAAIEHLRATWRLGDGDRLTALACRVLEEDASRVGERIDLLLARAEFLGRQSRREDVREVLDEAYVRARERRDTAREAKVLLASARARFALGRPEAGREAEESLLAARRGADLDGEMRAQVLLADIATDAGRWQQARAHRSEVLEIARRRGDAVAESDALHALGVLAQATGAFDQAEELLRAALDSHRLRGDLAREAETLTSLASVEASCGDIADAEAYLVRALRLHQALGDAPAEARDHAQLGMVLQEAGRLVAAREEHRAAAVRYQDLAIDQGVAVAELNLATTEAALGRIEEARDVYGEALRLAKDLGDERLQGFALIGLGEVARQRGAFDLARDLLRRAAVLFRRLQDAGGLQTALLAAARAETLTGDPVRARSTAVEAHRLSLQQNAHQAAALAGTLLALLDAREGRAEVAERRAAEAGLELSEVRRTDAVHLECLFLQSLVLRVLGRGPEADRKVLHAESVALEVLSTLPEEDRGRVAVRTSPVREILAGAESARAAAAVRPQSMSETVAV